MSDATTDNEVESTELADSILWLERQIKHLTERVSERKAKGLNASFDQKTVEAMRVGVDSMRLLHSAIEDDARASKILETVLDTLDRVKTEATLRPGLREEVEDVSRVVRLAVGNLDS